MVERLQTLQALIRDRGHAGDHDAVIALTRNDLMRWSYQDLALASNRLASGLQDRGVAKGETVGLFAPNSVEWIIACLGVFDAGGVVTPFDVQMPTSELTHAINDSGIRHIFTTEQTTQRLEALTLDTPPAVIRLDVSRDDPAGWIAWSGHESRTIPNIGPEDQAALFYTSGTTGPPKGVPLSHGNISSNIAALLSVNLARAEDRILNPLPYHHVYPFAVALLTPLALGASIILPYSVIGPQIVRALREADATVIIGVPRLFEALDGAIRSRVEERGALPRTVFETMMKLSQLSRESMGWRLGPTLFGSLHRRMGPSVRMVVSGGAPLNPELAQRLRGLGWELATGYGLTETSPILTYNPPDKLKVEAAGLVLPGVELRIAEQTDQQRTGHHAAGEVQAKGPNVFSRYWNLPDKTAKAFTSDGYYRTGDLGWFDDQGYLHLEGRASDMIVLPGGENVDPGRVESALMHADAIRDVGVLEHEGRLVALVQPASALLREHDTMTIKKRIRQAGSAQSRALPSHHQVSDYRIDLDPLPRTRLGKLRRHKLRERYQAVIEEGAGLESQRRPITEEDMASEDQQLLQIPTARRMWTALAKRYAKVRLTPDSNIRLDLNIDSLGWLELTLDLREQTGVNLDEDAIAGIETVRDLLRAAAESEETTAKGRDLVEELRHPDALLNERHKKWLAPQGTLAHAGGLMLLGLDKLSMASYFRLTVHGAERIPEEPVLFVANHQSLLDPPALAAALSRKRLENLYWSGWRDIMFSNALVRGISRAARVLPIDPASGPRTSLALGATALARGHNLVWFPEGQRSETGELQPFLPGVGLLLQAQPVTTVPLRIHGTRDAMRPGQRWPRPAKFSILIGEPTQPDELEREGSGDTPQKRIANALHDRVAGLKAADD